MLSEFLDLLKFDDAPAVDPAFRSPRQPDFTLDPDTVLFDPEPAYAKPTCGDGDDCDYDYDDYSSPPQFPPLDDEQHRPHYPPQKPRTHVPATHSTPSTQASVHLHPEAYRRLCLPTPTGYRYLNRKKRSFKMMQNSFDRMRGSLLELLGVSDLAARCP